MKMKNLLQKDIDTFESYVNTKIGSKPMMNPIQYLNLMNYFETKNFLFNNIFKNNLIIEKKVTIKDDSKITEQCIDEIKHTMEDFTTQLMYYLIHKFNPSTYDANFISYIAEAFDFVKNNKIQLDTHKRVVVLGDKGIIIDNNAKYFKTMKKFVDLVDNASLTKLYEDFRVLVSKKYYSEKNIDCTLCLSIHPIDYLTLSDSTYYKTCLSWDDFGEYAGNTLSYLSAEYAVVAYIRSDKSTIKWKDKYSHKEYEWYDKKWRQVFFVNPYSIIPSIPYPYYNSTLTNTITEWIFELHPNKNNMIKCDEREIPLNDVFGVEEPEYNYLTLKPRVRNSMYDDFYNAIGENPYYYDQKYFFDFAKNLDFKTGLTKGLISNEGSYNLMSVYEYNLNDELTTKEAACVTCGINLYKSSSKPLYGDCDVCSEVYVCCYCGERIPDDDVMTDSNGSTYHSSCYYDKMVLCDLTGEFCEKVTNVQITTVNEDNVGFSRIIGINEELIREWTQEQEHIFTDGYIVRGKISSCCLRPDVAKFKNTKPYQTINNLIHEKWGETISDIQVKF